MVLRLTAQIKCYTSSSPQPSETEFICNVCIYIYTYVYNLIIKHEENKDFINFYADLILRHDNLKF